MKYFHILLTCLLSWATCEGKLDKLKIDILEKVDDCEQRAGDGDTLTIHYVGKLASDGTQFDSSYDRQRPFVFQLGRKQVIPGWERGIQDMCVGEKRRLHIPAKLGYGEMGAGDRIPPNSDLTFDVELIKIEDTPPQHNVFKDIDSDQDGQLSREEVGDYLKKQIPDEMKDDEEVPNFDQDKMVEEIFLHEDKDKNGFISHDEFTGPKHDEL